MKMLLEKSTILSFMLSFVWIFFLIKKYSIYDPNCNNFCHKLLNRAIVCNRLSLSYDLNS